jgi:hypothetical protein
VLRRQAKPWWEERAPTPFQGLACLRALPESLGAATISEFILGFALSNNFNGRSFGDLVEALGDIRVIHAYAAVAGWRAK